MRYSYEEAIRFVKKQKPSFLTQSCDGSGYVCPSCQFGSSSGEAGLSYNSQIEMYICPNCNTQSDVVQLMAEKMKIGLFSSPETYGEVIDQLAEIYEIEIQDELAEFLKKRKSYSEYINRCHDYVYMTDYFSKRGISNQIVDRFWLGYDENFTDGSVSFPAVILPTSENTYEARNLQINQNVSEKLKYRKYGKTAIFNSDALNDIEPVFVCSGIFDALSILECGYQAIALQSSYSFSILMSHISKSVPTAPMIICLATDELNNRLSEQLKTKMIPHIIASDVSNDRYVDINERLINDIDGLRDALAEEYKHASSLPDPTEEAREDYINSSAGMSVNNLIFQIKADARKPHFKTGFPEIDKILGGGLYTGLYTLGAISSLGKTTFLVQIADNLAKQGQDVLFFTLEQSKYELMCKSVSRLTYEYCASKNHATSYAKTSLGISDGRRWKDYSDGELEVMQKCFKQYQVYGNHIFYYEGIGSISVDDIREKVAKHIGITKNQHPIVMVDYLQVLAVPETEKKSTDKQIVDYNITALRQLARDFETSVFCISALNRQSYADKISMGAFKESGNIEYGSDVLMGLQFAGVEDKNFSVETAKEQCPRQVELCILKNRNAMPHASGIPMLYDSRFNYFVCKEDLLRSVTKH